MVAWRHAESLPLSEQALALARGLGAREAEVRALTVLGADLAYLGRAEEGLAHLRQALQLADEIGDRIGLERAYINLTDALTMLGRLRESARVGQAGLEAIHRYGIHSTVLVSNQIEALLAIGDWDEAGRVSAVALRAITASYPYMLLMLRADIELGRGDSGSARSHLEAALATLREDRGYGIYDVFRAELALWERRWTEAEEAVHQGLSMAQLPDTAQLRVWFCAKGLRAQAELAALARARRDAGAVRTWLTRAQELIAVARHAAAEASAVTPNAAGWLALAEAEYARGPRPRTAQVVGGGSRKLGTARAPAPRGVLPLAPGRGARRRPARHAPRRPCRSGRRTPSRPGSEPGPCSASSNCSPSARGSISRPRSAASAGAKHSLLRHRRERRFRNDDRGSGRRAQRACHSV